MKNFVLLLALVGCATTQAEVTQKQAVEYSTAGYVVLAAPVNQNTALEMTFGMRKSATTVYPRHHVEQVFCEEKTLEHFQCRVLLRAEDGSLLKAELSVTENGQECIW